MGLLFLLGSELGAQVVIKEKVELSLGSSFQNSNKPLTTTLTVPAAGNLKITFNKGWRRGSAIPSAAHFYASLSGSGNVVDANIATHLQHTVTRDSMWCPCTGPFQNPDGCESNSAFFYFPDSSHPFSEFDFTIGNVFSGEIVNIFYQTYGPHGENLLSQVGELYDPDTVGNNFVWMTGAGPGDFYWCNPNWQYSEAILFSVVLSLSDTVERFLVVAAEDTILHGDMTTIRATAVDINGWEAHMDTTTLLRFTATPDSLGSFIRANGDTVHSPLSDVRYIDARMGRIKFVANGGQSDSTLPVVFNVVQQEDTTKKGIDTLYLKPSLFTILLGETKYYRAKNHPTQNDKLIIEETQEPVIGDAIADSVWSGAPVAAVEDEGYGRRIGAYWDLKVATIRTDTLDPVVNDLPLGLIRVIGRYWVPDSTYKVRLHAERNGRTGELLLEVKRPDRLGTTNNTVTGPTILNAVDSTWNLDSLIIYWAGKEGILPQIIKGIIRKESIVFHPSYRYEPFADVTEVQRGRNRFVSTHRYWIAGAGSLGNPPIPQHNNVHLATNEVIQQYPGYQTVWEYYNQYDSSLYTRRVYKSLQNQWNEYFKSHLANLRRSGLSIAVARPQATVLAETSYVRWLRNEIGDSGMVGVVAQTRIAASYGLMQLTYYSGVQLYRDWGYNYPDSNASFLPEYINIPRINIRYGTLHFLGKLRVALGPTLHVESTWPMGFEKAYWWGLKGYNGKKTYPNPVFGFSAEYRPRTIE